MLLVLTSVDRRCPTLTNVLIAEMLRERGRRMLQHPALTLFQAAETADETAHELQRRLDRLAASGDFPPETIARYRTDLPRLLRNVVQVVVTTAYAGREEEARERVPADPRDWPTVALALELNAAILTQDRDFCGCGVAVWHTETLLTYLRRAPGAPWPRPA